MSGDAPDDHSNGTLINLPFVFLFNEEGETLRSAMAQLGLAKNCGWPVSQDLPSALNATSTLLPSPFSLLPL
ncbi:unnamed protein product [Dibothriocephalus latus]|uniref:Uncharacterized protein n=1 Tax=Dibothriocephalus latus TaxID=60516 RepID=A0A3P7N6A3_DIBLA|nr:unnamed protein product [Dibothriocephalus latus]